MIELTNRHGAAFSIIISNIIKIQSNKTLINANEYFNTSILTVDGYNIEAREEYKYIRKDIKKFYNQTL